MELRVTWGGQCPAELLTQLGEWLESKGDSAAALKYYASALAVDAEWSLGAYRAGHLLTKLNRPMEAAEYLERATAAAPDHAPTWYLAGKVSLSCGQPVEALRKAQRAIGLDPNHTGAALVALRALVELQEWSRILEFGTDRPGLAASAEVRLIRALAHCRLGDPTAAKSVWSRTTLRERRRFPDLAKAIAQCLGT